MSQVLKFSRFPVLGKWHYPSHDPSLTLTLTFWMHLVHGTKKGLRVKPNPPPPRCNIILLGTGGRLFPWVLSSSLRHPVPVVSHRLGGLLLLFPARYPVVSHRLGGTHTPASAFYSTLLFSQLEQLILCVLLSSIVHSSSLCWALLHALELFVSVVSPRRLCSPSLL